MKTQDFLTLLQENQAKPLIFEYENQKFVAPNYHITEVKNVTIDTVDCGGGVNFWKETIIQLWESPEERGKREYMTSGKALSILNKVDAIKPMEKDVAVKFEYSNPSFNTAQLFVHSFTAEDTKLVLRLGVEQTDCKAKEACVTPMEKVGQKEACCTPESGCC